MTAHDIVDITGRLALVTGPSRGLGRSLALALAEAGARVVIRGRDRTGEVRLGIDDVGPLERAAEAFEIARDSRRSSTVVVSLGDPAA